MYLMGIHDQPQLQANATGAHHCYAGSRGHVLLAYFRVGSLARSLEATPPVPPSSTRRIYEEDNFCAILFQN